MKKSVLLFASLLLAAVSAIAQPAKPTVTYSDWASVEEKADIYLYNVESTYNDLIMGAGEFKGNKWFIAAAQDQRDGKACYMFENKSGKNYLTADNKDGIWVDGDTGRPYDGWYIAKDNGDKTFQLGYMLRTEKKDEAGNVIKEGDKTVYEYSSMGIFGVQKFDEGKVWKNSLLTPRSSALKQISLPTKLCSSKKVLLTMKSRLPLTSSLQLLTSVR